MPVVGIPALMRNLTDGEDSVTVSGNTIREVIENLDKRYPGTKDKLCDGDKIRPGIAIYVNGILIRANLRSQIDADAELHFLPAISGGVSSDIEALYRK